MERNGMMEAAKRQSYRWWFDSNDDSPGRSQWLHSTLSELDERTKSILKIIEEDADSFAQRAEMYYKKRPQLVSLVEDFYRTHRSLAVQFDHLRNDPATRRTSPLVRSFALSTCRPQKVIDPLKSYDGCFTKLAYDSEEFCSLPLSKGSPEKPFVGRYTELAYDSEESIDSEVDDPVPEVSYEGVDFVDELSSADLMDEVDRLQEETMVQKKQLLEKEKAMDEIKRKLYETRNEAMELKEETETLRLENVEMYLLKMKDAEQKEQLIAENATLEKVMKKLSEELRAVRVESQEQKLTLEEKDEEKREAIRQLSLAIDMMKRENLLLKKSIANESTKKWNPFEFQGFRKLFNCSISIMSQPSVVPL